MRKATRKGFFASLGLIALLCSVGALIILFVDKKPDEQVILNALGEILPVYWYVESLTISVSSEEEVEGTTSFKQRFEATVAPKEHLYIATPDNENIGPFVVIVSKTPEFEKYKLHGIATSTLSLKEWSTKLDLDNSVGELGLPRSSFDSPVLVADSEEAARVTERLNAVRDLTSALTPVLP